MKKKNLLKCMLALSLLGGSILCLDQIAAKQVMAEDVSSEEEVFDMSFDTKDMQWWGADKGYFVSIPNWYYSGKGFSFDFKFKDRDIAHIRETIIILQSDWTDVTTMADHSSKYRAHFNVKGDSIVGDNVYSEIGLIRKLEDGWYRYEVMLSDFGSFAKMDMLDCTINQIKWNWAGWRLPGENEIVDPGTEGAEVEYYNNMYMKNMHIIDHYSEEAWCANGDTNLNLVFSPRVPQNAQCSNGGLTEVRNWHNSNLGFAVEFEDNRLNPASGKTIQHEIVYKFAGYKDDQEQVETISNNLRMFRKNGQMFQEDVGRLFPLGNNWYRYEIMLKDVPSIADKQDYNLSQLIILWCPDGYGASKYRNITLIDGYTYNVTFNIEGVETLKSFKHKAIKPEDPVKDNYHFVAWYTEDTFEHIYDFGQELTNDLYLYARFALGSTHNYNKKVTSEEFLKEVADCSHGNIYYYSCECGMHNDEVFDDGNLDLNKHDFTLETYEIVTEATCEHDGEYKKKISCSHCGKLYHEETGIISKTGHKYIELSWSLSEDKQSATLILVCLFNENEKKEVPANVKVVRIKEATSKVEGLIIYSLSATYEGVPYSSIVQETIARIPVTSRGKSQTYTSNGCGGSIFACNAIISSVTLLGFGLLLNRKKEK